MDKVKIFHLYTILLLIYLFFFQNLYIKRIKYMKIMENKRLFNSYSKYLRDSQNLVRYNDYKKNNSKYPFISICIPLYNSEKYIKNAILSIINQNFEDFELIIVDDFSTDNSTNIIKLLISFDCRIKIISHKKRYGTFRSRIDGILFSRGHYIFFFDSDDLFLNKYLLNNLYIYYLKDNYDIIEFVCYSLKESNQTIDLAKSGRRIHSHKYRNNIIFQPELKDIIFYNHKVKRVEYINCRSLWSKIFKRFLLLKSIKYFGKQYYNLYLIYAEDTLFNFINFFWANNYTYINIPGYLYYKRHKNISFGYQRKKNRIDGDISYFYFVKFMYKNIKEFDRNRNFLFNEMKSIGRKLNDIKNLNITQYIKPLNKLLIDIIKDKKASKDFKNLCKILKSIKT